MKGKPEVLAALAEMLKEELGAISQYILHAEIQDNWGYQRVARLIKKQSIGEMKHAEKLVERILFLEGMPKMDDLPRLNIGADVRQQLKNDLDLEKGAVKAYNEAIETCRKAGDNATADFLTVILKDEENHVDLLETQLGLIEELGLQNFLSEQIEGEEE